MQCANALKATIAMGAVDLAGSVDLKPLQADAADLKSQEGKLQSDVAVPGNSADEADSMAHASGKSADDAQKTTNQAVAGAQAAQSAVEASNEDIDRMFKRSVSK